MSSVGYVLGAALLFAGLMVGVQHLARGSQDLDAAVDSFQRVTMPSSRVVFDVARPGSYVLYTEGMPSSTAPESRDLALTGAAPGPAAGSSVALLPYPGVLTYERLGHSGRALFSVRLPAPGRYSLEVTDPPQAGVIALGPPIADEYLRPVAAAERAVAFGAALGALAALVTARLRRGRKGRTDSRDMVEEPPQEPARVASWARSTLRDTPPRDLRPLLHWLLLGTFLLLPLQNLRVTAALTMSDLLLVLSAAVALASRHPRRPWRALPSRSMRLGVLLLAVGGLVGLVFSSSTTQSLGLLARLAVVVLIAGVVVLGADPPPGEVRAWLHAFVGAAAVSSALAVAALATGASALNRFQYDGRAVGLTLTDQPVFGRLPPGLEAHLGWNPNLFGLICTVGGALALALAVSEVRRTARLLLLLAGGALVLGVLTSGSRSALFGLVVALVVLAVRLVCAGYHRWVAGAVAVAGVLAVAAALSLVRLPSVDRLLLRSDTEASIRTAEATIMRYDLVEEGVRVRGLESLVVGSGLRNDAGVRRDLPLQTQGSRGLEIAYLELWVGLGLIGLAGWLLVIFECVRPALDLARRRRQLTDRESVLLAVGLGFLAYAATALLIFNIWNRYIWLLVALVVVLASPARPPGVADGGSGAGSPIDRTSVAEGGPPGGDGRERRQRPEGQSGANGSSRRGP